MAIKGSKEAQQVISQGYFFRCNEGSTISTFGYDGFAKFQEILDFETIELGNRDIYYTVNDRYGLFVDKRKKPENVNEKLLREVTDYLGSYDPDSIFAMWGCADSDAVEHLYGKTVVKVEIPEHCIVASDLGQDGVLIVAPLRDWNRV